MQFVEVRSSNYLVPQTQEGGLVLSPLQTVQLESEVMQLTHLFKHSLFIKIFNKI